MVTTVSTVLAKVPSNMAVNELRLLIGAVLNQSAVWLLTHGETTLSADQILRLGVLVDRRQNGEPMAYILGRREFYGRDFHVTSAVLIPRPETEMLVDLVKASVGAGDTPSILDLGTGSGCIAISIALECPAVRVTAIDAADDALEVASINRRDLQAPVDLIHSNWFSALVDQRFDIIVSNPPYIAPGDSHLDQGDLRFEPAAALSSGENGLSALRTIIGEAPCHLKRPGMLALEHGYDQAVAVRELLQLAGFTSITQHKDIAGITRVSRGLLT